MTDPSLSDGTVFRHAGPGDVPAIHELVCLYAKERLLLPRPPEDILEKIGNFYILELNGQPVGCAALRDYGNSLYEIRSLAVRKEYLNRRFGSRMVEGLLKILREKGEPARVFALTYRENFFIHHGFRIVDKKCFPEKIWSDCVICPKKDRCDEIAVLLSLPEDTDSPSAKNSSGAGL